MRYEGPIFDADVHHQWVSDDDVIKYLPKHWQDYARSVGITPPPLHYPFRFGTANRLDAFGPKGEPPGSLYKLLCRDLLDKYNIQIAVLGYDAGDQMAHPNTNFTAEFARAANDWSSEQWLGIDDRLRGLILVPANNPIAAAAEIRRVAAAEARMIGILLADNGGGQPFGHPVYDPIYEAANEVELPLVIHFGSPLWGGYAQLGAGGMPLNRFEYFTVLNMPGMHHVASMITNGVFDRFKRIRVLALEVGITWIPWLFWQLDSYVNELRRECPTMERRPSEYIGERLLFSTQPMEPGPTRTSQVELIESVPNLRGSLCFASDYPHFDTDEAYYVSRAFPDDWLPDLFYGNAARFFRAEG